MRRETPLSSNAFVDRNDLIFVFGLALFGYGLYCFRPELAFVAVGAIVMLAAWADELAGLAALLIRRRRKP